MATDTDLVSRLEEDLHVLAELLDLTTRQARRLQVTRGTVIDAFGLEDVQAFHGSVTIDEVVVKYRVAGDERKFRLNARRPNPPQQSASGPPAAVSRTKAELPVAWTTQSDLSTETAARISQIQTILRESPETPITTVKLAEAVLGTLPPQGEDRWNALAAFRDLMKKATAVDPQIWAPTRKSWQFGGVRPDAEAQKVSTPVAAEAPVSSSEDIM